MENLNSILQLETFLNGFLFIVGIIITIAKFLFLTIWGWIIILLGLIAVVASKARNQEGEFSVSGLVGGFTETLFWFYSNITAILVGIVLLFFISVVFNSVKDLSKSLTLYRDVKMLEAAMKNLKAERKLIDLYSEFSSEKQVPKTYIRIKYYAYSAVKDEDIYTGESSFIIEGRKIFVDFGVINFDYSLIEKGLAKNLAFPGKVFSETVSADKGIRILAITNGMPLSYKLDNQNIYLMDESDYQETISRIFSAVTNDDQARKLGIRTHYSEAIGFYPVSGKTYGFFSTGSGGVVVR